MEANTGCILEKRKKRKKKRIERRRKAETNFEAYFEQSAHNDRWIDGRLFLPTLLPRTCLSADRSTINVKAVARGVLGGRKEGD